LNNNNPEIIPEVKKDQEQNDITPSNNTTSNSANTEPEDKNWAAIREQRKADRKAREEANKRAEEKAAEAAALKAALEALTNKPSSHHEDREETEDERLNKRVDEIIRQRETEYRRQNEEREKHEYPTRLRQSFPDFDKVCDPENLDYLEYHHPEIVEPFKHMPDGYRKWEALYKVAKKLIPNLDSKKDQKRIEQNLAKPGSLSSAGSTQPTGNSGSNLLTEERRQKNWERMQRSLKGLS
jgi:hypothetical protein